MQKVKDGLFVQVDYKGTLQNGDVFDSSEGRQPLEFQMGKGQLIKGFEEAVRDMNLNEKKVFTLEPEDAYGLRDENQIHDFPRSQVPPEFEPKIGECIMLSTPEGQQIPAKIASMDDNNIQFDLNHPLAGEALTFEIEVVGISETPTQEAHNCGSGCDCSSGCAC